MNKLGCWVQGSERQQTVCSQFYSSNFAAQKL